eukprot:7819025-Alexandrium_andersonii.AAC.1
MSLDACTYPRPCVGNTGRGGGGGVASMWSFTRYHSRAISNSLRKQRVCATARVLGQMCFVRGPL